MEATGRRLRASMVADSLPSDIFSIFSEFFYQSSVGWKGGLDDVKTLNNNRGMAYQTDRKESSNIYEDSLRRDNLVHNHLTINYGLQIWV